MTVFMQAIQCCGPGSIGSGTFWPGRIRSWKFGQVGSVSGKIVPDPRPDITFWHETLYIFCIYKNISLVKLKNALQILLQSYHEWRTTDDS
jgi:hypothetical protein